MPSGEDAFKRTVTDGDVLRLLLDLWERTCVHPARLSVRRFVSDFLSSRQYNPEGSTRTITWAILHSDLLLCKGRVERDYLYQWNPKAGPPTLQMAREVQDLRYKYQRDRQRSWYRHCKGKAGRADLKDQPDEALIAELTGRGYDVELNKKA